jgi:hypothetical protein
LTLLSFGEDAEEEEAEEEFVPAKKMKMKSSHDVLEDDPRLKKDTAVDVDEVW